MSILHYNSCPVCASPALENKLQVKDYTVSGELFWVAECGNCSVRITQDVPDEKSIGTYYKSEDYISHTNTAKGIVNRLYHFVRQKTLVRKRRMIQKVTSLSTGKILDIGSGTGAFLQEMKNNGWEATGLEPDANARKVAKDAYQVELADMDQLSHLPAGHFDAITMWHVLEHVHDLHPYLQQLKKLLKPSGRLLIAVPNYTSYDASVFKEFWAAYDVPRHLYHFSPRSMDVLTQKNEFTIEAYKPMWYDSFYISILATKYKDGKTNWLTAAWTGLRSNMKAMGDVKKCSSVIYVIRK